MSVRCMLDVGVYSFHCEEWLCDLEEWRCLLRPKEKERMVAIGYGREIRTVRWEEYKSRFRVTKCERFVFQDTVGCVVVMEWNYRGGLVVGTSDGQVWEFPRGDLGDPVKMGSVLGLNGLARSGEKMFAIGALISEPVELGKVGRLLTGWGSGATCICVVDKRFVVVGYGNGRVLYQDVEKGHRVEISCEGGEPVVFMGQTGPQQVCVVGKYGQLRCFSFCLMKLVYETTVSKKVTSVCCCSKHHLYLYSDSDKRLWRVSMGPSKVETMEPLKIAGRVDGLVTLDDEGTLMCLRHKLTKLTIFTTSNSSNKAATQRIADALREMERVSKTSNSIQEELKRCDDQLHDMNLILKLRKGGFSCKIMPVVEKIGCLGQTMDTTNELRDITDGRAALLVELSGLGNQLILDGWYLSIRVHHQPLEFAGAIVTPSIDIHSIPLKEMHKQQVVLQHMVRIKVYSLNTVYVECSLGCAESQFGQIVGKAHLGCLQFLSTGNTPFRQPEQITQEMKAQIKSTHIIPDQSLLQRRYHWLTNSAQIDLDGNHNLLIHGNNLSMCAAIRASLESSQTRPIISSINNSFQLLCEVKHLLETIHCHSVDAHFSHKIDQLKQYLAKSKQVFVQHRSNVF